MSLTLADKRVSKSQTGCHTVLYYKYAQELEGFVGSNVEYF